MGSTPLLRDSHREAESATGCRSAPPALLYLLDMAGHRGPRQATTIPAASTASPPTAASGRQGKPAIMTCAAALTPGLLPPGKTPGCADDPAGPPPAVAEPAWATVTPCAAASTAAELTRALTSRTVSAPDTARNTPTSRRARPRVAMTAARPASEATASAPASGTTACPLTVTVLPGMGAGVAVTTRAHPWWTDSSTSRAPAAATPRTSAYSRAGRPAGGGRWPPVTRSPVTGRPG